MRPLDKALGVLPALLAVFSFACGGSDQSSFEPLVQPITIAIHQGNNQSAAPGERVPIQPSVKVADGNGKPVFGRRVTFAVASGGGSLRGENQSTNGAGIATLQRWTLGAAAGTNTVTATSAGLSGSPVTFTAMGDSTISPWDY